MRRPRVLVVDDEEFPRLHLVSVLRGLGIEEIVEAGGGSEARALIGDPQSPFDLVISDIDMPDLDGRALARWLREEAPAAARGVPLALISGQADPGAVDGYALAVLSKPATSEALSKLLRRAGLAAGGEA